MSIEISSDHSSGTLYLVATPIGNLSDISQRAVDVLKTVDLIAAEDTRHSQRLLSHLGVRCQMLAYHEHNEEHQAMHLVNLLRQGRSIALISDAGTPLVSDPGYRLLEQAHLHAIKVVPIPGACAAIAALSAAGQATDRFTFEGFPPAKQGMRTAFLGKLGNERRTMVFYISCHRVVETLADMRDIFGAERMATFTRELTKTFETIRRATLAEIYNWVSQDEDQRKGEIVLVVAGKLEQDSEHPMLDNILSVLLDELPVKQAAKIASRITGMNKNDLYRMALERKQQHD